MTKIEWTHRPGTTGETWNPVTGCTKISAGCTHCYAERMSKRLAGRFGYPADDPFRVTLHPDKLGVPLKWPKPRTVFVCSMSDLFHEDVPDEYICDVLYTIWQVPQHTFMVLTKRPQRMLEWFNRPAAADSHWHKPMPNLWLGVTCENQARADERIPLLLQCPAAVRFVSYEPALGPIALEGKRHNWLPGTPMPDGTRMPLFSEREGYRHKLDWIIAGAETGPGARAADPAWFRSVRDQCKAAGVPFFFKKVGQGKPTPDDLMVREWPEVDG